MALLADFKTTVETKRIQNQASPTLLLDSYDDRIKVIFFQFMRPNETQLKYLDFAKHHPLVRPEQPDQTSGVVRPMDGADHGGVLETR